VANVRRRPEDIDYQRVSWFWSLAASTSLVFSGDMSGLERDAIAMPEFLEISQLPS